MNSPRSLEACKSLGVDPGELYYLEFDEFKTMNPEVKKLPKDLQDYHYEQFEKFRNDTINQIKEARQKIIEAEKEAQERSKQKSTGEGEN